MSRQSKRAALARADGVEVVRSDTVGTIFNDRMSPRFDSWENVIFGIGGWRDPSSHTRIHTRGRLDDQEIEAVLAGDHFGARVIEALPAHAMRPGWDLVTPEGNPQDAAKLRDAYTMAERRLLVGRQMFEGARWGRAFGGAITWIGADDGLEQWRPLDEENIRSIEFLHTFDRRYVFIASYYQDPSHPKYGQPELYRLLPTPLPALSITPAVQPFTSSWATSFTPQALRALDVIGTLVHESRLVRWPGELTTFQRRLFLQGWDDSILERCWEPLKQVAEDYAGKSLLLGRISQAVYYIEKLYEMGAGKEAEALRARLSQIDLSRSRARGVVLDANREKYENVATPMGGMPELMDRGIQRLASAAKMPVSVLIELVTGGNEAASDADLDRWDDHAESWLSEVLFTDRHEKIARLIMLAKDGPSSGKLPEHWSIKYRPLRRPRPAAAASIFKTRMEAAAIAVDKGIAPPEAFTLAWFTGMGFAEPQVDRAGAEAALARRNELAKLPPKDNAELGTVGARASGQLDVVDRVVTGKIPRESGIAILVQTFRLSPEQADEMLGPKGWEPEPDADDEAVPGPTPKPPVGEGAGAPQGLPGFNAGGDPKTEKLPAKVEGQ